MKKAIYTVKIRDKNAEQILSEIDNFFIELEQKYTNVQISA